MKAFAYYARAIPPRVPVVIRRSGGTREDVDRSSRLQLKLRCLEDLASFFIRSVGRSGTTRVPIRKLRFRTLV